MKDKWIDVLKVIDFEALLTSQVDSSVSYVLVITEGTWTMQDDQGNDVADGEVSAVGIEQLMAVLERTNIIINKGHIH